MSYSVGSSFPSENALIETFSGRGLQRTQDNALLMQQHQQQIGAAENEMIARAAGALLAEPDVTKRSAMYEPLVQQLRLNGFAKNAPPTMPDEATLRTYAAMGTTAESAADRAANKAGIDQLLGGAAPGPQSSAAPAGDGTPFAANNPLNIRYAGQEGAVNTRGFAAFPTPEAGQAATDRQLMINAGRGGNTLAGLISVWAPKGDGANDPEAYTARVARETGIDPNAQLDLSNPATRATVQKAMAAVEGNRNSPGVAGVAARTGGVDVAGPGAPTPGAAPAGGSGPLAGLTQDQVLTLRAYGSSPKATTAGVADRIAHFKEHNAALAHQALTDARADRGEGRADIGLQLQIDAAKRAGLPTGYRLGPNGVATPIPGLPPPNDPTVPSGYRRSDADPTKLEFIPGGPADPKGDALKANKQAFEQENTLRDEFQKLTGDFRIVQTSYENIRSAAKAQDGAGDMSMLYNYVRLLDPTSVVRESEFAAAAASGSFGQRVQGAVERVLSGARMPDSLRQSFLHEGENLYNVQLKSHNTVADQYEGLAKANNLDPGHVVTRFARPQDTPAAPRVIRYDHQGNRVAE